VTSIHSNAFSGCTGLNHLSLPPNLGYLGPYAFAHCQSLAGVILPPSLYSISGGAFFNCLRLTSALFLGDVPSYTGPEAFGTAPSACTVFYRSDSAGFTMPAWLGYRSQAMDPNDVAASSWLMEHGWPPGTDMSLDEDGDGVSLFLAYALNLDPRRNQSASLPEPVLSETTLGLHFPAARPELSYRVESSMDLDQWTTAGVHQIPPGPDGTVIATVPRNAFMKFLRLVITK
jgi:hypothetical protein